MYNITGVPGGYQALSGQSQKDRRRAQPGRARQPSVSARQDEVQISDAAYELARSAERFGDDPER